MAYKQNFKSPILKALVGKQGNLPQHLQDAIKAAPESPAKKKRPTPAEEKKARFENRMKIIKDGPASKYPKSPAKMKDLSGDGKVTKKDVLIGRGVLDKDGSPAKQVSKPKKKMRRVKGPKEAEALETRKRTGHNPMPKRSPAKKVKDKEAYRKERKAKASAYMDSLKEKRAVMAEKSGDKGRAQRIRSTKDHQE